VADQKSREMQKRAYIQGEGGGMRTGKDRTPSGSKTYAWRKQTGLGFTARAGDSSSILAPKLREGKEKRRYRVVAVYAPRISGTRKEMGGGPLS